MPVTQFPDEWLAQSVEGLTPERLQELRGKAESGRTLWECVVAEKLATDAEIIDKLSHRFRLKIADVTKIDPSAQNAVPSSSRARIDLGDVGDLQPEAMRQLVDDLGIGRELLSDDALPQSTAGLRLPAQLLEPLGGQALHGLGQPFVGELGHRHEGVSKLVPGTDQSSIRNHKMSQK